MVSKRSPGGDGDDGWTPRGMVTAGLMAVLAAVLVLSHFGVSTTVLLSMAAVAALIAVIALYRLPANTNGGKGDSDG